MRMMLCCDSFGTNFGLKFIAIFWSVPLSCCLSLFSRFIVPFFRLLLQCSGLMNEMKKAYDSAPREAQVDDVWCLIPWSIPPLMFPISTLTFNWIIVETKFVEREWVRVSMSGVLMSPCLISGTINDRGKLSRGNCVSVTSTNDIKFHLQNSQFQFKVNIWNSCWLFVKPTITQFQIIILIFLIFPD